MAEIENTTTEKKAALPVAGYFNGMFTSDIDGAMGAVIVNPSATHAQRLAWALGQLALVKTLAGIVLEESEGSSLASATQQVIEQAMAVVVGVHDELADSGSKTKPIQAA